MKFLPWKRPIDRDAVFGGLFIFPAIVLVVFIMDRKPPTAVFWACCALALVCLLGAKHKGIPIAAAAQYMIGPVALVAIFRRRIDAILLTGICGVVLAAFYWFTGRPERLAHRAFAEGRHCPACSRPLQAGALHYPVAGAGSPDESLWFHRCRCGEYTLFDGAGNARKSLSEPPQTMADGAA